jgi:DNA adenine methylase
MKPFLRWAGGKTHLIDKLLKFVPYDFADRTYREPFLGGGAMFFALCPPQAILSDLNSDLINCYKMIRKYPGLVSRYLSGYSERHSAAFYYEIREQYNISKSSLSVEQAARFIYLNKASFNGIFRVNKNGKYNVPFGKRTNLALPSLDQLVSFSNILKNAELFASSFEEILNDAQEGDFVYLDPPYPPLDGTSYFTHYTKERFGENDQLKLFEVACYLRRRHCLVMISNADILKIRKYFKNWNMSTLPATRWITCKAKKFKVNELVITNYKLEGDNYVQK